MTKSVVRPCLVHRCPEYAVVGASYCRSHLYRRSERGQTGARGTSSAIEAETKLTPEQLKQQKTRREVQGRIAKRQALKKAGADVRSTNPDLAASLEDSLRRADRRVADKGRLQRLVQDRMAKDRKR
jgi:hypothetical protein